MKALCDFHGFTQLVREPTRQEYLLDLVITDIVGASTIVCPSIADHKGVKIKLPVPEVKETVVKRMVWHMASADWRGIEAELENM